MFGWSILHLFFNIFLLLFILGLCIGAIPDILEKDVNTILADIRYYFNDSRIIYIMILLDINEKLYEIK